MANYCSLEDVYPLIQAIGVPTDSPVAALITLVSAEIDGHLRARGYVLPVVDTEALVFLTAVCAFGVGVRTLRSLFPAAEGVSGDAGSASALEKVYAYNLGLIDKGGLAADMVRSGNSIAYDFDDYYDDDYSDVGADTRKPTSEAQF